jgi:hypothetical protein
VVSSACCAHNLSTVSSLQYFLQACLQLFSIIDKLGYQAGMSDAKHGMLVVQDCSIVICALKLSLQPLILAWKEVENKTVTVVVSDKWCRTSVLKSNKSSRDCCQFQYKGFDND